MPRLKIWDGTNNMWQYVDNSTYLTSSYTTNSTSASYSVTSSMSISASYTLTSSYISNKRELLTTNRSYYVNPTGSNSNDGLTTTTAFQTIQYALDYISNNIDRGGWTATVQLTDGTYNENIIIPLHVGSGTGSLTLSGSNSNPGATIISGSSSTNVVTLTYPHTLLTIKDLKIDCHPAGGSNLYVGNHSVATIDNLIFGRCVASNYHMNIANGSELYVSTNGYSIFVTTVTGSAHVFSSVGSQFVCNGRRIRITGSMNFTTTFAWADTLGMIYNIGNTYTSSSNNIFSSKYSATVNGAIVTLGGANYFPGNSAGSTGTGGQYV